MKSIRSILSMALVAVTFTSFASVAFAQESATLNKIKESGFITLGHRETSIPFSYYDDKLQVIGFSQEVMLKAAEAVKEHLKLAKLETKLLPVSSITRITLVQNGTVDMECGATTNNTDRQKQVAFSNTFFIVGTRLMVHKASGIKDFPDLAGKNVVTVVGSTSERILKKMNDEKAMKMNIISSKDHGESFLTLETGRAAAFMMDDALLYGEIAKAKRPSDWAVVGTPQSKEAYACILRKGDPGFKKVVDAAIAKMQTSGEMDKIYAKWFFGPIPPKGLNLNMPMPADMKALHKSPNDKAYE